MEDKYLARRGASVLVDIFSKHVLGPDAGIEVRDFELRDGYHSVRFDRDPAAERFAAAAPPLMSRLLADLAALADELAEAVVNGDGPYIAAVGELSWLLAKGDYCYAACQLSSRRKRYVLAQPVFTYLRNVDSRTLPMNVLRLPDSFESLRHLDLAQADRLTLRAGESRLVNGFEELIWFEESGIAFASISTLPLGAYEATYDAGNGERVGLFSTEMRLSSVEVVLRTLAAAGWPGALDVAQEAATHAVRELRWAALNYVWRCDPPDLPEWLNRFVADEDAELAALARQCLTQAGTAAEQRGAGNAG
jgi:hypothetical protein